MIIYANDSVSDAKVLTYLRSYTAKWFTSKYSEFTPAQRTAIPLIKKGHNVLISSPTGTGKTLAAFLAIIDELYRLGEESLLEDSVYAIYVSPLRALNNDIRRNLIEPIEGIRKIAKEFFNKELPEIRVKVRTSDTSPYEKQKMLRNPPHILITTPESLAIILVAPKFRKLLSNVRWVIVDEIHELASTKRGVHLSLSIERLENLVGRPVQRIGLSATIAPLEEVAKFLVGLRDDDSFRDCVIVDARFAKPMDIKVIAPKVDLLHASAEEVNEAIYRLLTDLISKHRTTLVFTNTRSATERVVYKLRKIFEKNGIVDADRIEAHHSSLSRDVRLDVEEKLKNGLLRCVVSSTSLELGIDIGYIDLVVLLSSPKSVTRLLQRIGRAGHYITEVSKGRVIVVDRDDMVECVVLAKLATERKLDNVKIPRKPLDVLAQHIVGLALERKYKVDEAYRIIKRSYCYKDLTKEEFIRVLKYLAGYYADDLELANVYSKIWYDEEEGIFGRKRGARMIYYLNSGTIPDETKIKVFLESGWYVGDLEESFVEILSPGDVFVLGGRTYEFVRSDGLRVYVRRKEHARPTVPSWYSEMLPLAFDSALGVGKFRRKLSELIKTKDKDEVIKWLMKNYNIDDDLANYIYDYFKEQIEFTDGLVPSDRLVLIELWVNNYDYTLNVIFHTLFGRKVNNVLSRAYAYIFSKYFDCNVRVTVTDNGFMLTLPMPIEISTDEVKELVYELSSKNLIPIVRKVIERTELFKRRFRHCAERSFAILRRYKGSETSISRRQFNSEVLLNIVKNIPGFPIYEETFREILEDYMDVDNALKVIKWVEEGVIKIEVTEPRYVPSPFAHNIVVFGYTDVVLMEDRRRLLIKLREEILKYLEKKGVIYG